MKTLPLPCGGLLFCAFLTTNCTSSRPASSDTLGDIEEVPASRTPAPSNSPLPRSADVEALVDYAVRHSPVITASEAQVRRMNEKVPQAAALPDPMATVALGSMAETAAGRVITMTGLQQKLPLPGKLDARGRMAQQQVDAARAMRDTQALKLATQVRSAYWDLYLAHRSITILSESTVLLETVQSGVQARLKTNQANQADLLQVATETARVEEQRLQAQRDRDIARARLNTLLHRPPDAPLPPPRWTHDLPSPSADLPPTSHPSLAEAEARLRQFNAQLRLAQLERYPDLTLGLQHAAVSESGLSRMSNGRDQFYATLGINIPLWQEPRRAAVREAQSGITESAATLAATRDELAYQLAETRSRIQTQLQLISLFDDRILTDARQTFDVSLAAYTTGTLGFVDLIERWRRWLGYQIQQEMNRATLGKAVAAWQQAAGIVPQ